MNDLKDELKNELNQLSKADLIRVLWYARYKWFIFKVKTFGSKFFPFDPMFYLRK